MALRGANPKPADLDVRHAQLDPLDAIGLGEERLLVGRRACGDRQRLPAAVERRTTLASSARAAARTTVGNPAPDWTAAVISSRAARSSAPVIDGSLSVAAPDPDHAAGSDEADAEHRGEHVEGQHGGDERAATSAYRRRRRGPG